ncbi:glucose-6-phosphate exchanger SLC37A1 isoform X3 [Epinephelus lanceolatus]|uniref:glucose-6-phosphate exchanger SLC37A1 isoform X3 n=1 Tax=Epinephelus lanceolatus TaxID=310571 RepID=UPI001446488F|nr:glucose-6-phosphate exchanger SLC37A1 isoform X3 [Epinephelus lanceolatus]
MATVPPGIRLLVAFDRDQWYRALTFILTFLLYTSFHLSRKPISIVKSELHKNCSSVSELATIASSSSSSSQQPFLPSLHTDMDCSWKPFDKRNYRQLLGAMDYSFLCAYAVGMYLSGIIGERLPIRLYLTVGMLTSGLFTCLFGLGYVYNIHNLGFYIFVQVANGLVQTTGWPSVVTCIGNWFGKGRRGLIMGLWNSHTSVGNILGSLIAGYWVSSNWGLSFIVPGLIIAFMGIVCFLFLIEHPNDVKSMYAQNTSPGKSVPAKSWSGVNGHTGVYLQYKDNKTQSYDTELLLPRDSVCVPTQPVVVVKRESEPSAISFMGALRIPCLHKLQLVQNSAARIITRSPSMDHITPVLRHLHWLPVKYRIDFKILLLTFKALHNQAPSYLSEFLHIYTPSRTLRSSSALQLISPSASLSTMGSRAFSCSDPHLWNSLPHDIRNIDSLSTFKSLLNTPFQAGILSLI